MLACRPQQPPSVVLALGAHCDDVEIGCAGTLGRLRTTWPEVRFHWCVLSGGSERAAETTRAAERLLGRDQVVVEVADFRQSYFPHEGGAIKDWFERLKAAVAPDLVFTHCRDDAHQDHRIVSELTWNSFRNHMVLEYEIPKYDGDMGRPNFYVPLTAQQLEEKCRLLMDCFPSQHARAWFTPKTFEAIARLRGIECNAPDGYAEAFYARKAVWTPG